jgi:hypothetical protein
MVRFIDLCYNSKNNATVCESAREEILQGSSPLRLQVALRVSHIRNISIKKALERVA